MEDLTPAILEVALQAIEAAAPGSSQDFLKLLSEDAAMRIARAHSGGDDTLARFCLSQLAICTARIVLAAAND